MGFGQPEVYRNTVGDIRVPFKGYIRVPLRRSFKGSIGIMVYSLLWVMQDLYVVSGCLLRSPKKPDLPVSGGGSPVFLEGMGGEEVVCTYGYK